MAPITAIYLVVADTDGNGDDHDLVVEAVSPEEALKLWEAEDEARSEDTRPLLVYRVPAPTGVSRALAWGPAGGMELVWRAP